MKNPRAASSSAALLYDVAIPDHGDRMKKILN